MDYLKIAKDVLNLEANALAKAATRLSEKEISSIVKVFEFLKNTGGTLVFCGVGKSGQIAEKLVSTFASLGLRSSFLHPVEALHGDLGRVGKSDAIIFLSKSGTTEEILKLMPFMPVDKSMRIGFLGNVNSPIADECDIVFDCSVETEACINNLAPTTSSTLALAMGDSIAVVFESMVNMSKETFAINHPGGLLGKSLRMRVKDLMWKEADCPKLKEKATLKDVILEMTKMPVGGCAVVDDNLKLLGIMVEGDIRRTFMKDTLGLHSEISEIMNKAPITIAPDELAYEALKLMENREKQIDILPVTSKEGDFLGFIRLHDLLKEGFELSFRK